jgi:dethiobiotin synthetase
MSVRLADVLAHVRAVRRRFDCVLVEGAGGVLSPLGEGFSARELIVGLRAVPAIACPNRLGAVNQALLAWAALPRGAAARSRVVLMTPRRPDTASASNAELLREHLSRGRVHVLPWLDAATRRGLSPLPRPISEVLDRLLAE